MEPTCDLIALSFELAACMKRGEDQLQRRLLELRMCVDGNAAAVVGHGCTLMILVECDLDT